MEAVQKVQEVEEPISMKEVKAMLMVTSRTTIWKWINEGKIRAHKPGKQYLFFKSELTEDLKKL